MHLKADDGEGGEKTPHNIFIPLQAQQFKNLRLMRRSLHE
jgi:hypothetical protein